MKVGMDGGHGGKDPGAIGLNGLQEKDVNLAITQGVYYALVSSGIECYMTRNTDESLDLITRTACINNMKCDLSVSIHCNASENRDADYIATYIQATGGEAEKLAKKVQARLITATGWKDGGIKVANLHMNRETNMPSILVECGFISNPAQEQAIGTVDMQRKLAVAIAKGILDYAGIKEVDGMKIKTVEEAVKVLQAKGIIANGDHWRKAPEHTKYIDQLLINMANFAVNK